MILETGGCKTRIKKLSGAGHGVYPPDFDMQFCTAFYFGGIMCTENWRNNVKQWLKDINRNDTWLATKIKVAYSTLYNNLNNSQRIDASIKESIDLLMNGSKEKADNYINQVVTQSAKVLNESSRLNLDTLEKAFDGDGLTVEERNLISSRLNILITQATRLSHMIARGVN